MKLNFSLFSMMFFLTIINKSLLAQQQTSDISIQIENALKFLPNESKEKVEITGSKKRKKDEIIGNKKRRDGEREERRR